ncbi:MAG TPA: hypothetical protein VIH00_12285, partial [Candidatus Limnocylindrales bacterium]
MVGRATGVVRSGGVDPRSGDRAADAEADAAEAAEGADTVEARAVARSGVGRVAGPAASIPDAVEAMVVRAASVASAGWSVIHGPTGSAAAPAAPAAAAAAAA